MKKYFVILMALLLLSVGMLFASSESDKNPRIEVPRVMDDWSWANAPWKASDAPYIAIRQEIDKEIAMGKSRKELIQDAQQKFSRNQHDSKLAFAWAYAFYGNNQFDAPHDRELAHLIYFSMVSAMKDKQVSYEYARMEFLVATSSVAQKLLTGLGNRLLNRKKNDDHVKFRLAVLLAYGMDAQKQNAKNYAQYFLQRYPKSYGAHSLWAVIYLIDSNFGSGNSSLADKAIAESRIAKTYLPSSADYDSQRQSMDSLVAMINNNRKQSNE